MAVGPIPGVQILGGGTAFPPRVLTNEEVLRHIAPVLWPERRRPIEDEQIAFLAAAMRGAPILIDYLPAPDRRRA